MAAPSNFYRNEKLITTGLTVPTTFNSIAIPDVSSAELLERYHLEWLLPVETPSGSGFIGLVESGSTYYNKHSQNRIGSIRVQEGNAVYLALNDAGLNCLPRYIYVNKEDSTPTGFTFTMGLQSSYHNVTTEYGIYLGVWESNEQDAELIWNKIPVGYNLPANQSITINGVEVDTENGPYSYQSGDRWVYPYATNEEGTIDYTSQLQWQNIPPEYYQITVRYHPSFASYAVNNTNGTVTQTVYCRTPNPDGVEDMFYIDSVTHYPVEPGYYAHDVSQHWFRKDDNEGDFLQRMPYGSYNQGDPAAGPLDNMNYHFYVEDVDGYFNVILSCSNQENMNIPLTVEGTMSWTSQDGTRRYDEPVSLTLTPESGGAVEQVISFFHGQDWSQFDLDRGYQSVPNGALVQGYMTSFGYYFQLHYDAPNWD